MNKIKNDSSEENNIIRCPSCYTIPYITYLNNEKREIKLICENNHKKIFSFNRFFNQIGKFHSNINYFCAECGDKISNEKLIYCQNCNFLRCHKCKKNDKPNHILKDLCKISFICEEHDIVFSYFCNNCNKNICQNCINSINHNSHNLIKNEDIILKEEEINQINNLFKEEESYLLKINKIVSDNISNYNDQRNIIFTLSKFKQQCRNEISFLKQILELYLYFNEKKILNHQIIMNIREILNYKFIKIQSDNHPEIIEFLLNNFSDKKNQIKKILHYQSKKKSSDLLIPNIYPFKLIKNHENYVTNIIQITDKRIASSSIDCSINIYNNNTFILDIIIMEHEKGINYITAINNNKILSSSTDSFIKIIKIKDNSYLVEQILLGHFSAVNKSILLSNNDIASCSWDRTVRIWTKDNKTNLYFQKIIICVYIEVIDSIFETNNKKLITASFIERQLRFWDIYSLDNKITFNNIICNSKSNIFCQINNDILAVCGYYNVGIYLIDIKNYKVVKIINQMKYLVNCIIILNNNTILTGEDCNQEGVFEQWNFDKDNILEWKNIGIRKKCHDGGIISLLQVDNDTFISCANGNIIKIWKC